MRFKVMLHVLERGMEFWPLLPNLYILDTHHSVRLPEVFGDKIIDECAQVRAVAGECYGLKVLSRKVVSCWLDVNS